MPELNVMMFDLYYLFKIFPHEDKEFNEALAEYERNTNDEMYQIRLNLFSEFGYEAKPNKALI